MNTNFESVTLTNGFCVKTLQNNNLHSVNMGFYVRKPPEPVCGIAHLVEHLFFRRLADIPQNNLYFETDKLGGSFQATTYADFICFDITVSPSKVKEAFNIMTRIFSDFAWTYADIAAEKKVVKRQIEAQYESLYTKADLAYYKGTPKGTLLMGKLSDVSKMSAEKIHDYKNNMFIPQNTCFVLTGNFSESNLSYCVNGLSKIPDIESVYIAPTPPLVQDFSKRTEKVDKIYSSTDEYSEVCISFDVDKDKVNRYSAELLFSILGFGVTSKLSQRLREQKGFTAEVNGGIEFSDYAGRMTFEYDVSNENLNESLLEVFTLLAQSKDSLNKSSLEGNMVFYTENQYRLLDDVRELNFLIGWRGFIEEEKITSIDDLVQRYKNITIQEIKHSANEIFIPSNLVISVSNDNKRFLKTRLMKVFKECRKKLEV